MTVAHLPRNAWFALGLAFIGGYADAAGFLLANTFTGHVTGESRLIGNQCCPCGLVDFL